jgi:hypothetical protein
MHVTDRNSRRNFVQEVGQTAVSKAPPKLLAVSNTPDRSTS